MKQSLRKANDISSKTGAFIYFLETLLFVTIYLAVFQLNHNPAVFEGVSTNPWKHYYHNDQYALVADALIHGKLSLDLPVPQELIDLDNPYDPQSRIEIASEDVPVYWDTAYYHGKYYSYFGVVPAVLLFIPYQMLTGQHLKTTLAVMILGSLAILASSLLIRRLGKRYFENTATTLSLSLCLFIMFTGCNFVYLGFVARTYSVPILTSICLTMLGLWFWLGSAPWDTESARQTDRGLSLWRLAAGSTCMALNLGTRPQFILASLLAFTIFKTELFKTRTLFSRKGIAATIAAIAPYLIVFTPLLIYNYARFGSPLDFGSNYNLTGFDMTDYRQSKKLTLALMFTYLFQLWQPSSEFPFFSTTTNEYPALGWAPNEPFFGGFFFLMPLMFTVFLFPIVRKNLRRHGLLGFTILCGMLAVLVLFVDTRVAGITQRYFGDFGPYIALISCLVLMSLQERGFKTKAMQRVATAIVTLSIIFTVFIGTCTLFSPNRYDSIKACNPELYEQAHSLFD